MSFGSFVTLECFAVTTVEWNSSENRAYLTKDDITAEITLDSCTVRVTDSIGRFITTLETAPQIIDGYMMAPSSAITDVFKCSFQVDNDPQIITLPAGISFLNPQSATIQYADDHVGDRYSYTDFYGNRVYHLESSVTENTNEHADTHFHIDSSVTESGITSTHSELAPLDTIVYKTPSGEKYHKASCGYMSGKIDPALSITISEAKKSGLEPCSICDPDYIDIISANDQVSPTVAKSATVTIPASPSAQYSQASPDTTVYKSEHGRKYHRADCFILDGLPFEISSLTLADAQSMKLYPCPYCQPDREYREAAYESEPTEDAPETTEPTATIKPSAASIPSVATTSPTSKPTKADDDLIPTAPPQPKEQVVYIVSLSMKDIKQNKTKYHTNKECNGLSNSKAIYTVPLREVTERGIELCKTCQRNH